MKEITKKLKIKYRVGLGYINVQYTLYINFVDYEKALDSVDREVLWKLLRYYGIPSKMVNLIKSSYEGMTCRVIHAGQLTTSFRVNTGVRQGCLLSPFLFLIAIDWIMKTSTSERRNGIQWTLWSQLDDLDFADDLALLSHSQQQMQEKTSVLAATSAQVGLIIHKEKTKILKTNVSNINPITLNGCPWRKCSPSPTWAASSTSKVEQMQMSRQELVKQESPSSSSRTSGLPES